jgi:hypothetical protein
MARGQAVVSQGSPMAPVQRGQRREYDDGEGRSPGKKDGGAAHQGWSGANEVADGVTRRCFFKAGGAVKAKGLSGVRPKESLLASTWRPRRRRAPARCSSK